MGLTACLARTHWHEGKQVTYWMVGNYLKLSPSSPSKLKEKMMAEIVGMITQVEDDSYDGKAFKKVTLGTGQVLKVKYGREGALKAKWGLLKEGVAIKFTMKDFTTADQVKIPFVFDIETVESALPAPVKPPDVKTPDQPEINATQPPPAPQAVGMLTKEIGDMIRAKYLVPIFGDEASKELIKWYRSQAFGITRINFDGTKLPQFDKEKSEP